MTPKKTRTSAKAKARAMHIAPATNNVSGPTFFEISKRPTPVWFCDPETGETLEFNLKTAKFTPTTETL